MTENRRRAGSTGEFSAANPAVRDLSIRTGSNRYPTDAARQGGKTCAGHPVAITALDVLEHSPAQPVDSAKNSPLPNTFGRGFNFLPRAKERFR
jgi:hypothetical protein